MERLAKGVRSMSYIRGINLCKSYDEGLTYLFRGVELAVDQGKHIALIGANGTGKSTLLRILAGLEPVEGILQSKGGLTVYLHRQQPEWSEGVTVDAVLDDTLAELRKMRERLHALEAEMADRSGDELTRRLEEYGHVQSQFEQMGGYTFEQEKIRVLKGLGLKEQDLQRAAHSLSGGEQSKLRLACSLLHQDDILLFDEPTNHLDVESMEWLEGYLRESKGTWIVTSHDRYFLDQVAEEIWELEHGILQTYSGNYTQYVAEKERRLQYQWKEYEKQQRELKHLTQQIHDQRIYGTRAEKQGHGERVTRVMKKAKVAEAKREKVLSSNRVEKPFEEAEIKVRFSGVELMSGVILWGKDLTMGFAGASPLFAELNFSLPAQGRMGMIGRNGAGKTTLLQIIHGDQRPISGEVILAGRVRMAYYTQGQETLRLEESALENILSATEAEEGTVRTLLGVLRIEKEKAQIPVKYLSGGERSKVQLVQILLSGANLLLLDEPTNHLDIDCREGLERALLQFPGAIIFTSHDRYFLQKLAQQVLYLDGVRSQMIWQDYRSFRQEWERRGLEKGVSRYDIDPSKQSSEEF